MAGTFTVDPGKKPARLDLKSTAGRCKGETLKCIYEQSGDTLRLCRPEPGKARPKTLGSKAKSGQVFAAYKRDKR